MRFGFTFVLLFFYLFCRAYSAQLSWEPAFFHYLQVVGIDNSVLHDLVYFHYGINDWTQLNHTEKRLLVESIMQNQAVSNLASKKIVIQTFLQHLRENNARNLFFSFDAYCGLAQGCLQYNEQQCLIQSQERQLPTQIIDGIQCRQDHGSVYIYLFDKYFAYDPDAPFALRALNYEMTNVGNGVVEYKISPTLTVVVVAASIMPGYINDYAVVRGKCSEYALLAEVLVDKMSYGSCCIYWMDNTRLLLQKTMRIVLEEDFECDNDCLDRFFIDYTEPISS